MCKYAGTSILLHTRSSVINNQKAARKMETLQVRTTSVGRCGGGGAENKVNFVRDMRSASKPDKEVTDRTRFMN
jgi:hypothetical protein